MKNYKTYSVYAILVFLLAFSYSCKEKDDELESTELEEKSEVITISLENALVDPIELTLVHAGRTTDIYFLLDADNTEKLLEHHRSVIKMEDIKTIAQEFLLLSKGIDMQMQPVEFLSAYNIKPDGSKDHLNARFLGLWLGSLRVVFDEQAFNVEKQASWFLAVCHDIDSINTTEPILDSSRLFEDILSEQITLNEAMELLSYGSVTSSTVTQIIGEGIQVMQ